MPSCREVFFRHFDPTGLTGIEVGPLNNPVVRRGEGQIFYVDHMDTDRLRQYWHTTPSDEIEAIDIVWQGASSLVSKVGSFLDYAIANHVIEHIPNLVEWLIEIHKALRPGGALILTVPDKRFTFDLQRQVSTLGEVMDSYINGLTRPPLRALIDQVCLGRVVEKEAAWLAGPVEQQRAWPSQSVIDNAKIFIDRWKNADEYIDAHIWVFTPYSFLEIIDCLRMLKLFPYFITMFEGTGINEYDFHVHLEAARTSDDGRIAKSIERAKEALIQSQAEFEYKSRGQHAD